MPARGDVRARWERARAWSAANPWTVDLGIALLVQAAMTMPFVVPRPPELEPATWPAYGLTTLTVLPLVWRRRAPLAVLLAIMAASALYKLALEGPGQPLPYTGLVSVYTVAVLSVPWKRLLTAGLMLVAVPVSVWINTRSARELTFSLFVFGAAYAFGRLQDARQRAHRIEAEQAAARERARIAREMHDILSHAVSLMIVQAEAGPVAMRTAPERAEAAFDAISETGREAMTQLRQMLGLLREGPEGAAPREPQPDLAGIPELVERVRASGLAVSYTTEGGVRALPAATGSGVYRIVQEALTNVVKHAGARTAEVRLARADGVLRVTVTDDGRGPGAAGTGGHGLTGIRERAAAHGGTATTGPGPDGRGFEVRVLLPVPSTAEVGR
ncbi:MULTISPECIES: sensor histidine kinase [Streptomyces]|uniref:histidine kinase n=1 Tax=Streptomyces venezuelae (strain ATCC 10712 / CBS 650.69 / DSM 40230 / JCM 4526 / NBRC 13096 / PD 04745) TaxID=953739 RepID=F2R6I1_STRVP|nr:histidine kinase [Streptomyces venezuelae]APE24200.1 sensor histidine kinase [Streptomyces venezuelae]QES01570.1 two-component sensor histidine kinase [Streptomyces venezuelae ATCC 10712]CCA58610.1 putative two-component system sensor kinase [Streptomyces venezuelae ATCC 10712]